MLSDVTRRQLLRTGLAGGSSLALLGAVGRCGFANAKDASNIRLGLVTYLWGQHMSLAEVIASCEKSGLLGVELRTEHQHGVEPSLNENQRSDVAKRFADSPVELIGYGSNCEYHSPDPAQLKKNIEQTKDYIRLMHDCGGTGVKVKPNNLPANVPYEKTVQQIGKALNEVAAYGEGFGQKIRVEVHGSGTSKLSVIRDIFKVADHSNVYVCWNSNDEDLTGEGLEANFKMVQDRLGDTVHIRELNVGDYPYPQLIQLFANLNYEGWFLLEARTNPADKTAAMAEQLQIFNGLKSNAS
ncbi:MAG: sugar phosphate isomerase/epimerase [Planctomycetales bacterium]|nr:sugar phosphate isomerase/epimerase [Planctomycetales bacterium]